MKKSFIVFITLLLLLVAVLPVSAKSVEHTVSDITFMLDDSYTLKTAENLLPTSSVEGLVFVAISSDSEHQIQVRCTETEFSKQLGSFSGLDEETIKPAGDRLFPDGYETVTFGTTLYLKSAHTENDETSVVYVTVLGGKLYTFSYFGADASKIGEFMNSVTLPKDSSESNYKIFIIVLAVLLIVLDVAFIVFLIMSFVKDYRRKKMDRDKNIVSQYIKIKRRKY